MYKLNRFIARYLLLCAAVAALGVMLMGYSGCSNREAGATGPTACERERDECRLSEEACMHALSCAQQQCPHISDWCEEGQ